MAAGPDESSEEMEMMMRMMRMMMRMEMPERMEMMERMRRMMPEMMEMMMKMMMEMMMEPERMMKMMMEPERMRMERMMMERMRMEMEMMEMMPERMRMERMMRRMMPEERMRRMRRMMEWMEERMEERMEMERMMPEMEHIGGSVGHMSSSQSTEVVPHERSSAPDFVRKRSPTCPSPPLKSANVPFVDQTHVLKCDSNGKGFTNTDHDITLRVPPGAILSGVTVHIEAGVALHGPFQFPPGTRPISPIIWFCTQEGILFLKPVEVILPHFLHHWEDLELGFLKADHRNFAVAEDGQKKYTFQHSNDPVTFYSEDGRGYGILYTKHFCFSCIQSNITRDQLPSNAQYCLTKVIPEPWPLEQTNVPLHFCVTFSLKTCFKTLRQQFSSTVTFSRRPFTFQTIDDSEPRLQIEVDTPQCGWILARENRYIRAGDVDYWGIEHPQLQLMEEEKMYPPRFTILACGTNVTGSSIACLRFIGSCEDLSTEVPLPYHQPTTSPGSPTLPPSRSDISLPMGGNISPSVSWREKECHFEDSRPSLPVLLTFPVENGAMNIAQQIGTAYDTFGILLLNDKNGVIVDGIVHHGGNINLAILKKWLQGQGKKPVTWKTLVEVLRDAQLTVLADEVYENLSRLS